MASNVRYEIILYWSQSDQAFLAEVPELPGCAADGATYQEALANAEIVIQEWIETARRVRPSSARTAWAIDVCLTNRCRKRKVSAHGEAGMATLEIPIPFRLVHDSSVRDLLRIALLLAIREGIRRVEITRGGGQSAMRAWREDSFEEWVPPPEHIVDRLATEMEQLEPLASRWLLRLRRWVIGGKRLSRQRDLQLIMGTESLQATSKVTLAGEQVSLIIEMTPSLRQAELALEALDQWMASTKPANETPLRELPHTL